MALMVALNGPQLAHGSYQNREVDDMLERWMHFTVTSTSRRNGMKTLMKVNQDSLPAEL